MCLMIIFWFLFNIYQEDHKKLEVFAFELETKIASLEEQLKATYNEKEEAIFRNECLLSELETLTEKLRIENIQLTAVQDVSKLVSLCFHFNNRTLVLWELLFS